MTEQKKGVRGKGRPKPPDHLMDRERLLREFGMITDDDLAILLGISPHTLKNRPTNELPPFTKSGGKYRLYFKDDVTAYMRKRMGG